MILDHQIIDTPSIKISLRAKELIAPIENTKFLFILAFDEF